MGKAMGSFLCIGAFVFVLFFILIIHLISTAPLRLPEVHFKLQNMS